MSAARIDGVDISHWQAGRLDFAKAKRAGVRFVFHKATEGTDYVDPLHDRRRSEVAKAGVPFGAYHFARPSRSSGRAQARHFLAVAKPRPGDMRPALDLEDTGGLGRAALTSWVGEFVDECRRATGQPPIIYTNFALDRNFDCPRWAARYSNAMAAPNAAHPWPSWTVWQFSNGVFGHPNTVAGIGACDLNTLNTDDPAGLVRALQLPVAGKTPAKAPAPPKHRAPAAKPKPNHVTRARQLMRQAIDELDATPPRRRVCHGVAEGLRKLLAVLPDR